MTADLKCFFSISLIVEMQYVRLYRLVEKNNLSIKMPIVMPMV